MFSLVVLLFAACPAWPAEAGLFVLLARVDGSNSLAGRPIPEASIPYNLRSLR